MTQDTGPKYEDDTDPLELLDNGKRDDYQESVAMLDRGEADQASQRARVLSEQLPLVGKIALCHDFALRLLRKGKIGHAADFVADEAEALQQAGKYAHASSVLFRFAESLLDLKLYGWAGPRYYSAAMVYIAVGDLPKALDVLVKAKARFSPSGQEPFVTWLEDHVTILSGPGSAVDRVRSLQRDFERYQRNNWVRSCVEGIGRLMPPQSLNS